MNYFLILVITALSLTACISQLASHISQSQLRIFRQKSSIKVRKNMPNSIILHKQVFCIHSAKSSSKILLSGVIFLKRLMETSFQLSLIEMSFDLLIIEITIHESERILSIQHFFNSPSPNKQNYLNCIQKTTLKNS